MGYLCLNNISTKFFVVKFTQIDKNTFVHAYSWSNVDGGSATRRLPRDGDEVKVDQRSK